jgi:mRNA-degrading endonuclease toxin of MazEF toxin-antitoxin module
LNSSRVASVLSVPLTDNLERGLAPENLPLSARLAGLPKDSVASAAQIGSVDKDFLTARAGKLSLSKLDVLLSGNAIVPGE